VATAPLAASATFAPALEKACSSGMKTPCVVQPEQPQFVGYVVDQMRTALAMMHAPACAAPDTPLAPE